MINVMRGTSHIVRTLWNQTGWPEKQNCAQETSMPSSSSSFPSYDDAATRQVPLSHPSTRLLERSAFHLATTPGALRLGRRRARCYSSSCIDPILVPIPYRVFSRYVQYTLSWNLYNTFQFLRHRTQPMSPTSIPVHRNLPVKLLPRHPHVVV